MDYIRGTNRNQVILFPESVEDYITEDNPVRFIDAFVTSLDLAALGSSMQLRQRLGGRLTIREICCGSTCTAICTGCVRRGCWSGRRK